MTDLITATSESLESREVPFDINDIPQNDYFPTAEELSLIQKAIDSSNLAEETPGVSSIAKIDGQQRVSAYSLPIEKCRVWEGNRNRIDMGDIPQFAKFIMEHGVPSGIEGFIRDGILHITEGARRFTSIHYAMQNYGYVPDRIRFTLVPYDEFKLYARQINSESLNKSSTEKRKIITAMYNCRKEDGKRYTQQEIADATGLKPASISLYLSLRHADEEVLEAIDNGEISSSDVIEYGRQKRISNKKKETSEADNTVTLEEVKQHVAKAKKRNPQKDFVKASIEVAAVIESKVIYNDQGTATVEFTLDEVKAFLAARDEYYS